SQAAVAVLRILSHLFPTLLILHKTRVSRWVDETMADCVRCFAGCQLAHKNDLQPMLISVSPVNWTLLLYSRKQVNV
ncbi:unnamed protein product, partial [Mycena citricolor]